MVPRLAVLALLAACSGAPPAAPRAEPGSSFELIESAPIETTLDHADLRDAYVVWPEMFAGARETIDLAEFYVSNAPASRLEAVVQALEAAVARGVKVRLLVEKGFVKVYPETLERLTGGGVDVRHLDLADKTGGILHAKYFVVDGRHAYIGSQNLDWRSLQHIQELGARVTDPAFAAGLAAIFAADWRLAGGGVSPYDAMPSASSRSARHSAAARPGAIELVASPRDLLPAGVAWDLPRIVALIDGAKQRIRMQALSYRAGGKTGLWTELDDPLRRAAARGVRVELLLADWSKRERTIDGLKRLARVPGIEIRLATIPPWSGGFVPFARVIHAKLVVADGRAAWLGTSNFERDYFYGSRNVGIVTEDPALASRIDAFFETGWASTYAARIDPDATYAPPRIE